MTREQIREIIDKENGVGFSDNINLNGYTFTKNGSFIVFELKHLEDVKICHIKYIHFNNEKDLTTIMVNCCNFWMGNKVQFIYYKEKEREFNSAVDFLEKLNFRTERIDRPTWRWPFTCRVLTHKEECTCPVFSLYK